MPVGASGGQIVELAIGSLGAVSSSNPIPVNPGQMYGEDAGNPPIGVTSLGRMAIAPAAHEIAYALMTPTTIFSSTATVVPLGRTKVIWLVFTAAVTFASNTPTVRLFGSRTSLIATTGATTGLPLGATYLGAAVALTTAAVTSIPINTVYRFSSTFASSSVGLGAGNINPTPTTGFPELDRWDNFLGIEFNWIAAPGAGTVQCYLECGGT